MSEIVIYAGERTQVGSCENMYYLRWDQRKYVTRAQRGIDLWAPEVLEVVRFRFPWPDEDRVLPGQFLDPDRGLPLRDYQFPEDTEHGSAPFRHNGGYQVTLPCPEGAHSGEPEVHHNGYGGPARLVFQGWRSGRLAGIVRCNGCGRLYVLPAGSEEAVARSIRTTNLQTSAWANAVADRLLAGYRMQMPT